MNVDETSEHVPLRIWQERPEEFSYQCACGAHMKHQPFGTWPACLDADRD